MEMTQDLADKIKLLPNKPGIYQYFNQQGEIIYVGKAKNLKKRVQSYFTKKFENSKTKLLVHAIKNIHYLVVDNEFEALLLENNLIKEYQPKYNIQLKDGKTYPWICIKNEHFPRVFATRNVKKDKSEYFGPYSSVKVMNTLIHLIRELYPIRTCNLDLATSKIKQSKYKVCLEYHIGNCLAPCVGLQSEDSYNKQIDHIRHILKGNISQVINFLKQSMEHHAEKLEFEQAQANKHKIEILKNYQSKSTVVSPKIKNLDVITLIKDEKYCFVNYLMIVDGSIVHGLTLEVKTVLNEDDETILNHVLYRMKNQFNSLAKEVVTNHEFPIDSDKLMLSIPKIGDKKKLIDLSEKNAQFHLLEKHKKNALRSPEKRVEQKLNQLKKDFKLKDLPVHIECFDNSNIQGTNPVSACVVFKNGKPSKRDYRHFNVKTVEGPNDFASMQEVVYRRYKRLLDEESNLPQLIIIDGGKGQLSAALKALDQLKLVKKIAIVGIAKKLEEIFFPGDSVPLYIDKRSESLKLVQHMRDEAHRFGITHHRNKRSKAAIQSEILTITGIGEKTHTLLMQHFKTVNALKSADEKAIEALIGKAKTKLLRNALKLKDSK